jgi:hypothetical protein
MTGLLAELLKEDPWTATALLALLAVLAAIVVHTWSARLLRRAARGAPILAAMLERTKAPPAPPCRCSRCRPSGPWRRRPPARHRRRAPLNGLLLIAALTWLAIGRSRGLRRGRHRASPGRRRGQPAGAPHPDPGAGAGAQRHGDRADRRHRDGC